jgi:hypothetical protein
MSAKHGGFTDPLQPEGRIDKWTPSQTDPLHHPQPLNPQPLPPGFQDEQPIHVSKGLPTGQTTLQPMWGVGRGLRNPVGIVLVVVLVLGLLALGIGTVVRLNQGSQPVQLSSPGVYAWEDSTAQGQSPAGVTTPCKGTLAAGVEQQLIGGGYTLSRSQVPITARPVVASSSARSATVDWATSFASTGNGAQLTNYAICLREPTSFFGGAAVQYESSGMKTLAKPGPLPIKVACPAGTSVLGGGYVLQPLQAGEAQPPTIDSSFPYADGSGTGWEIVSTSVNGFDKAQAWAVCTAALHTHLESASVPNDGVFQRTITCAKGTLLGGGFDLLQPRGVNSFSTDYARQDSPGQTLHQDAIQGDTFSDWRVVGELNGVGSHYTATLWAVCWDQNGPPPVTAPTTAPTQVPTAAATASPAPQPTRTPIPSCSVVHSGSVQLSSSGSEYVNLDTGKAPDASTDANIEWTPPGTIPATFKAKNGALLSGPLLTDQTCPQLKTLTYVKTSILYSSSPMLFAVKLPDGHYAEVKATTIFGSNANYTRIVWTTYYP